MHFDDVFDFIGPVGNYQILLLAIICAMELLAGDSIQMNFMGYRVDSWCRVPRLANFSYEQQQYIAIPDEESCRRFDVNFSSFTDEELVGWNRSGAWGTVACDQGWVHDQSEFRSTVVTEWDLLCGRDWMVELISTVYMGGRLVGALSCGPISDRFGRKPTALGFHFVKILGAVLASFVPHYEAFSIGRVLMAIGSTGSNLATFVLVAEICGRRYRAAFGCIWNLSFSVGCCIIPGVAYYVRDYVKLQHAFTWPNLVMLLYFFCLDESPRWLVSKGRDKEALVILHKVAAVNRCQLPENITFTEEKERIKHMQEMQASHQGSIVDLFRTPNLRKSTCTLWLAWFTGSLMFYGLSLNSGRLPGDVFLNTFLLSAVEIPANLFCIYMLDKAGRRPTVGVFMLIGGFVTFLCIPFLIFDHLETGATVLSILGKAFVTVAFTGVYVQTSELVPTTVRNIALGTASMWARIAGMAAPYVGGPLSDIERYLPSIVFGTLATLTGTLVLTLLPETLGQRLPDTIEEAENFKPQKLVDVSPDLIVEAEGEPTEGGIILTSLSGPGGSYENKAYTDSTSVIPEKSAGGTASGGTAGGGTAGAANNLNGAV